MATALSDETPQSITIRECYNMLIDQLKSSVVSLGDALFAKGLIPPDSYSKVLLSSVVPADKAREVFLYLIERFKHDPNAYNGFIEILAQNGQWTDPVVKKLNATLACKQSHFHDTQSTLPTASFPVESARTSLVQPLHRSTQDDITASCTKRNSLEAQQIEYDKQFIQRKEKLTSVSISPSTSASRSYNLEKEWEEVNCERLGDILTQAKQMVKEANSLLETFDEEIVFRVVLAVPRSLLSSQQTPDVNTSDEVLVRVLHRRKGSESVWSVNTLQEKLVILRDIAKRKEGGAQLDVKLPFDDSEQPTLLGLANFCLVGLKHNVPHEYSAPIVTATGEEGGHLKVIIVRCSRECTHGEDSGLCPGDSITCQINVLEATGMSKDYRHCVFCQYQFQGENVKIQSNLENNSLTSRFQTFQHSQEFRVTVDEDFLDIVNNGALSIEVWGQRENTEDVSKGLVCVAEGATNKGNSQHSVADEVRELAKRLEVWVEIQELNEQGEYVPVAMRSKPEVITGGVFKIRQGHSQKINVTVHTVSESGNGLLLTNNISSVSIGSIDLCSSNDRPLDSFQSYDLERLCDRWGNDLQRCQEHLEAEYRKLDNDQCKQKQLFAHRYMVVSQRDDVLQLKKVTSELPGAPTDWKEKSGFECKVPILFLDDPLVSDDSMETMFLCGEREESMLDLKIVERHEYTERLHATTLWDVAAHNTDDLNKVTQDGYRVYAILKVGVALYHPTNVVLELRKRICMKVYNRKSALSAFTRSANDNRPGCGVMYDVVLGVPKTRGMQPPPIIPPNPSLMELHDDEDPMERLKTALTSVGEVLSLDKLKQEVSLKEKLSEAGQRKRLYSVGALSQKNYSSINVAPLDKRFVFELSKRSQSLRGTRYKASKRHSFKL